MTAESTLQKENMRLRCELVALAQSFKEVMEHPTIQKRLCKCGKPECKTWRAKQALARATPYLKEGR